jgi:ParB-like chromosome segregation protein Spo0J
MTDTATDMAAAAADSATAVEGAGTAGDPLCVTDPANPACARRMIAVDKLTAHPGNVRENLDLTPEFCASVAENGVRIPLLITTDTDDGYRVIEGHRRLAAAVKAGLAEVPYDLDGERAGDEAGQYLDMVTANSAAYRRNFTPLEEATALFAAHEAGATRTRIRKVTGRRADQVKTALAAGGLSAGTREQVGGLDRQLTLDELALLAEFDSEPEALEQLLHAVASGYPLEHVAERIRQEQAEAAEHERVRADLEAAGVAVTGQIVPGSSLLASLVHDGEDLTPDSHQDCPGHGAFFRSHDLRTPVFYCADPAAHGHSYRWAQNTPSAPAPIASDGSDGIAIPPGTVEIGDTGGLPPDGRIPEPIPDPAAEQARRLVTEGNRAWAAAAEVRKRWVQQLLWRRTAPKAVTRFVAEQLLTMPDALRRGLPAAAGRLTFIELTGKPLEAVLRDCDTYPPARLPLLILTPIAIAYESEIAGDGDRRNTWRTDRWAPCSRKEAGRWLTFLAGLGYELSAIERAVARDLPYEGEDTPGEPETGSAGAPDRATAGADPAEAGSGQADSEPDHQADPDQAEGGSEHAGTGSGPAYDGTGAGVPDAAAEPGEDSGAAVA